jgi:hypothetical protein
MADADTDFEGWTDAEKTAKIAHTYSACMHSVDLINAVIATPADYTDDATILSRNIEHCNIILGKTGYWTTEDLTPLQNAAAVDTSAFDALVAG